MKFTKSLNIDNLSLFILILLLSLQLFTICNLVIFFCCICLTIVSKKNRTVKGILIIVVYGIKTIEIMKMREGDKKEGEREGMKLEDKNECDSVKEGMKLEDKNEIGSKNEINEKGIENNPLLNKDQSSLDHPLTSLNKEDDPSLTSINKKDQCLPLKDNPSLLLPQDNPPSSQDNPLTSLEDNPNPPKDNPSLSSINNEDHPSQSNHSFLVKDNFLKESKPLNVSSIPFFTEIKIQVKSKDLSEGKIVMNGIEIGNFETRTVQTVT